MKFSGWNTVRHGSYFLDSAPTTVVGLTENWASPPRCYFVDVVSGECCQTRATMRLRLRGGVLVQEDDWLVCPDHVALTTKYFQERIQELEKFNQYLADWAQQNPCKPEDKPGIWIQRPAIETNAFCLECGKLLEVCRCWPAQKPDLL